MKKKKQKKKKLTGSTPWLMFWYLLSENLSQNDKLTVN